MAKRNYENLICSGCSTIFTSKSRLPKQKYCSSSCAGKHNKNKGRFKKGNPSWNIGTNNSGMKGRKHTRETKEKMRQSSLGEKAWNWKGGVSKENYRIRRSAKYKDWRKAVFERDNYTCCDCGARSAKGKRVEINADHIKPFAYFPDLRFDVNNGRTLCIGCHKKTATWGFHEKSATLESTGEDYGGSTRRKHKQQKVENRKRA